jgi:TP901 family phage tail tape measure protein
MAESIVKLIVDATQGVRSLGRFKKATNEVEGAVLDANGRLRDAKGRFIGIGQGAKGAAVGVRGLGAAFSAALGPLTAVVGAAASLSQVFNVLRQQDFAEAKVRSLGVNSKELNARLKDVSTELSGQASVLDLTGAAYDVASAGFNNAADAALILKAATQGATGGFSDINTVGDATTSVLNAYGLEADKAAKLVDGFIQTQNDGKIVISEYAANIAKVAPVAAALGVPLEEVNAAVAQITAGGQGAEVTFTALKTAFSQVAAGKAGEEFKALGIEINASTLKSDGLAGTLEKIKKSGADAGTVIKAFGTEAGPSILALLNNTEKYNQLLENQKEAQGAAAKAAFTASDTIDGQLKRLTTAFQNLFSDQSELGVVIKETFKVAAVTVEVLTAAINAQLAPLRAIFAAVNQVGIAISQALGVDGTNAAFQLEEGFQNIMKTVRQVQNVIIGFGVRIGQVIGKLYAFMIDGGKNVAKGLGGVFAGLFAKVTSFIQKAYSLIPAPIKQFLEDRVGQITSLGETLAAGASSFFTDTAALGAGFAPGAGLSSGGGPQDLGGADVPKEDQFRIGDVVGGGSSAGRTGPDPAVDARQRAERIAQQLKNSEELKINLDGQFSVLTEIDEREKIRIATMFELSAINRKYNDLTAAALSNEEKRNLEIARGLELGEARIEQGKALETIQQAEEADSLARFLSDFDAAFQELDAKAKAQADKMNDIYKGIGDSIQSGVVDALTAAVDGTKSLAEVASATLKDIGSMFLKLGVNQLFNSLGSGGGFLGKLFGSAKGNIIAQNKIVPFAKGGIVGEPTIFPLGNGTGLMGEAGPEAIMPLKRGPGGRLGVEVTNTREQLNKMTTQSQPLNIRFESQVINNVEYVTAEQHRKGMAQAAERGRAMTLTTLQNSPRTRSKVGI